MDSELAQRLLLKRLNNKQQLKLWLKFYLGVDLADNIVSRYATSTPLDMVWEVYQFCADQTQIYPLNIRFIAGRNSQKTLSLAVLQILLPLHFKRSVVHLGGTVAQAQRAYTYLKQFVKRPYISPFLVGDPTQKLTTLRVDGEDITIEILPITEMSVQGAHAPIVSMDELASLAPNKQKAYPDIQGIPQYTKDGKPWARIGISSRKGAHTVIEQEYKERHKSNVVFKFWTVLENTQRCPDELSGTEPFEYYIDILQNIAITKEEYALLDNITQSKYELVHARKGCYNCPLRVVCAGDLKKQQSDCTALRPVYAVITDLNSAQDYSWFLSQLMSLAPSVEGLVFSKFKREKFEKTARELYTIFMGEDPGREITEDELISLFHLKGLKCYAGLDHGYTDPLAIVIMFEDSIGRIYIVNAYVATQLDPDQIKAKLIELHAKYKFTHLYPDPAQPAINQLLRKAKICKIIDDFNKQGQIEAGIALIRQKMNPLKGEPLLYGLKGNVDVLIDEFERYHYTMDAEDKYTDKPEDKYNHAIDALRYAAINRWRSSQMVIDAEQNKYVDPTMIIPAPQTNTKPSSQDVIADLASKQLKQEIQIRASNDFNKDLSDDSLIKQPKKGLIWDI